MAKRLQLRGGTQAENDAFTGAPRELTVDLTNNELRLHDGVTQGGHHLGATGPAGAVGPIGMNWRGVYNGANTYAVHDGVEYLGSSYICVVDGTVGNPVDYPVRWNLVAQAGAGGSNGLPGGGTAGQILSKLTTTNYDAHWIDPFVPDAITSNLIPVTDSIYTLGTPTQQWKSLYVSGNTIYLDNIPLSVDSTTNTLQIGTTGNTTANIATEDFVQGTVQAAQVAVNFSMDGGAAASVFEISPLFIDGGYASVRHGIHDPVFDGNSGGVYFLDGGGA